MPLSALNCPNCGGPVQKENKNCKYCNASINFSPDYKQVKLIGFPCPKCGTPAEKGDRFCSKCASRLIIKCPSCRHDVPLASVFCPNCRVNFAVSRLIEEAKQKKIALNDLYTTKEQHLHNELIEFTYELRRKIDQQADALAEEIKGKMNIFQNMGQIIGVILIPVLSISIALWRNSIELFFVIGGCLSLLAWKFYPPFVVRREIKKLSEKVKSLRGDSTWINNLSFQEISVLNQKQKETEYKTASIKEEAAQEIKKIDEWLKDNASSVH